VSGPIKNDQNRPESPKIEKKGYLKVSRCVHTTPESSGIGQNRPESPMIEKKRSATIMITQKPQ